MQEQLFLTPKDKLGYAEEYIVVKYENPKDNLLLNYSLSNSIDDIKIAIYARTGQVINLDTAYWQINNKLSVSVKHLMNSHNVNYSMTIFGEENDRKIIVNMRVGDKWFCTDYIEFEEYFIGRDFLYRALYDRYYDDYFKDSE